MSFYACPDGVAQIWREAEARGWNVCAGGKTSAHPDRWVIEYWNAPPLQRSRATFSGRFEVAGTDEACIQGCRDALRLLEERQASDIAQAVSA